MRDIRLHEKTYPFDVIGVINQYTSLIWKEAFNEVGNFELHLPMSKNAYDELSFGRMLSIEITPVRMIIESHEIKENEGDGTFTLIIKGRSLESILDRRIVYDSLTVSGTLDSVLDDIIDAKIVDTGYGPRNIPHFIYQASEDVFVLTRIFSEESVTFYLDEVLDIVRNYCQIAGVGFQLLLDDNNDFVFSLYSGKNKTIYQSLRPPLMFSKEFDNLRSTSFFETTEFYKNNTVVIGQIATEYGKLPPTWLVLEVEGFYNSGLDSRETWTDASDVNRYDETQTLIPLTEYSEGSLQARGKDDLLNNKKIRQYLEANIDTSLLTYRDEYFLGDLVSFRDPFGNSGSALISEVVISEDETGTHIFPIILIKEETYYDISTVISSALLVAGGGAGGANRGGGGGGGEVLPIITELVPDTTYPVVVGAGGTAVSGNSGNSGGNTTFNGELALGGGGGGHGASTGSADGGKDGGNGGGGGGCLNGYDGPGGVGKYNGGDGSNGPTNYGGGGGGGDSEHGVYGYSGNLYPGKGGDGTLSTLTGVAKYYGGGGGGYGNTAVGAGGVGGGGSANNAGPGVAGTNGLGGGGGSGNTIGGNGGSGAVVLRIPTSLYTGVYTGSPTISVVGNYTVLEFLASGSYTA